MNVDSGSANGCTRATLTPTEARQLAEYLIEAAAYVEAVRI